MVISESKIGSQAMAMLVVKEYDSIKYPPIKRHIDEFG
jgi:hypothetical protein